MKVSGTFEVQLQPQESYAEGLDGIQLARMSIDKVFSGNLQASSKGDMLSARTPVEGSAGYVAIEQVTGELSGKKGSFVLQHFGVMSKDGQSLLLEVIPDSGTAELAGLSGTMKIAVENGQHQYEFDYEIA